MGTPTFVKLNDSWNAEPNDPGEKVTIEGDTVTLTFVLNPWAYVAGEGQRGHLTFAASKRWRLGPTNDESWFRGRCRYSKIAPAWGEFYEIIGPDSAIDQPEDWVEIHSNNAGQRHFLFYLRDNTFECIARDWSFEE